MRLLPVALLLLLAPGVAACVGDADLHGYPTAPCLTNGTASYDFESFGIDNARVTATQNADPITGLSEMPLSVTLTSGTKASVSCKAGEYVTWSVAENED